MILLIDNYDSFSYNVCQLAGGIREDIAVVRNDAVTLDEIERLSPERLIISPGPGRPENAGICIDAVRRFAGKIPILGICLGHQAICAAFGGVVTYASTLMHGKPSQIKLDLECEIFKGMPPVIQGARYHSLAARGSDLPNELLIAAETEDGEIMALRHRDYAVYGVQFHPESILTPDGGMIMANFLKEGA
jgi:anthranilate synthase component 2